MMSYARQISNKLKHSNSEIIFSPTSPGSQPTAYLKTERPVVIWTDTTFASVIDFYPMYKRDSISSETLRDGIENERMALENSQMIIYKTEWAAQWAMKHYHLDPGKVKVVPGGPSFPNRLTESEVEQMISERPQNECQLLFLGGDWERKGGNLVMELTRLLNENGLPAKLRIVGCEPVIHDVPKEFYEIIGKIDKSRPVGLKKLRQIIGKSHFIVMPTNAEAMGIAFIEANSFGTPAISTKVGGVPDIIRDGVNGKTFDPDTKVKEYADYITSLFKNYSEYKTLAMSAYKEFKERLNWDVSAQKVIGYMKELI